MTDNSMTNKNIVPKIIMALVSYIITIMFLFYAAATASGIPQILDMCMFFVVISILAFITIIYVFFDDVLGGLWT